MGGDPAYTLVQVAFNDLLMLGLYAPIAVLLIGVSNIPLPYLTIIYAVLLFIVAPTFIAVIARQVIIKYYGIQALDGLVHRSKPITIISLLLTLILTFIFQGLYYCVVLYTSTYYAIVFISIICAVLVHSIRVCIPYYIILKYITLSYSPS